jgi:hypothetical protein
VTLISFNEIFLKRRHPALTRVLQRQTFRLMRLFLPVTGRNLNLEITEQNLSVQHRIKSSVEKNWRCDVISGISDNTRRVQKKTELLL